MEAPQNRRLYGEIECLPLWPTYLGEKGRTLGKTYGIKVRRCWEHPLGNTLGTHWESDGDPLGTERKHVGNKEKNEILPPPPHNINLTNITKDFSWKK
jgi:hypothetical protein